MLQDKKLLAQQNLRRRFYLIIVWLPLLVVSFGCGEFGQGLIRLVFPPPPVPTPVADPDDVRLLENGYSVAEEANRGHFLYSTSVQSQKAGSLTFGEIWFTHTFTENAVIVQSHEFETSKPKEYTRLAVNVYQGSFVSVSKGCPRGQSTLTYNRQGFTIYIECENGDTSLWRYERLSSER